MFLKDNHELYMFSKFCNKTDLIELCKSYKIKRYSCYSIDELRIYFYKKLTIIDIKQKEIIRDCAIIEKKDQIKIKELENYE